MLSAFDGISKKENDIYLLYNSYTFRTKSLKPMKFIFTLVLISCLSISNAGSSYVVSPIVPSWGLDPVNPPLSGENFYLLSPDSGCYTSNYTQEPEVYVEAFNSDVRVFFKAGLGGSTGCVSPTPPRYLSRAEINGLTAGTYTLSIYHIPFGDAFPPAIVNYPTYFTEDFQFGVINGAVSVNSSNNMALFILFIVMLFTGLYFERFQLQVHRHRKPK